MGSHAVVFDEVEQGQLKNTADPDLSRHLARKGFYARGLVLRSAR